jgi:DNA-binding transcriptional ArsR family regulator
VRSRSLLAVTTLGILLALPVSASSSGIDDVIEAPEWNVGDWWIVEVRDAPGLRPVTLRLVVSAIDKGDYFVGVEEGDSYLEVLTFHFPFIGRVASSDLSYEVHNQPFYPLQFPMTEGDTWQTRFNDLFLTAKVWSVNGKQAEIQYLSQGLVVAKATYDADAKTITSWVLEGHGRLEVKQYGDEFSCVVEYPPRHELLFVDYAMGSTVLPVSPGEPKSIVVERVFERAAIVLVAGGAEGLFSSVVMPPDGRTHAVNVYPHDAERWRIDLVETNEPMGSWKVDSIAGNQGFALSEAIGFDLRTIDLGDQHGLGFSSDADCVRTSQAIARPASFAGESRDRWTGAMLVAVSLAGLGSAWLGLRRAAGWFPALLFLYAKIPKERVLESRVRSEMCELLKHQPALTTQEIRRALEIGWGNTVHHLAILERSGLVVGTSWGHNRHWFLQSETPASGRTAISALRRDAARAVFEAIRNSPGISQEDLAKGLSIHHSTVFFHVERLMRANLVQKNRDGARVRYFPTPDAMTPQPVVA